MMYNHRVARKTNMYLFAVRVPSRDLHKRLVDAAAEDGRTIGAEIDYLLSVREQLADLIPDHPFGRQPLLTTEVTFDVT